MTSLACQTPPGHSAGNVVDDSAITTKVKAKLPDDNILSIFTISVKTFRGDVTLTGAVKTSEQKDRAEAITRSVAGVNMIRSFIRVN
jgi:hyperosmotically inducible periplasmic protein